MYTGVYGLTLEDICGVLARSYRRLWRMWTAYTYAYMVAQLAKAQLASQHARPIVAAYIWGSRVGMYTRLGASVA